MRGLWMAAAWWATMTAAGAATLPAPTRSVLVPPDAMCSQSIVVRVTFPRPIPEGTPVAVLRAVDGRTLDTILDDDSGPEGGYDITFTPKDVTRSLDGTFHLDLVLQEAGQVSARAARMAVISDVKDPTASCMLSS